MTERAPDIRGRVLEFGGDGYTRRFGSDVTRSEIADVDPSNTSATLTVDLSDGRGLPESAYDCIVCTQTLQFVPDDAMAVRVLRKALAPGGVLLVTVPGISQVVSHERNPWPDYWRYTHAGLHELLKSAFPSDAVELNVYGNVFSAVAFLHGLAAEELSQEELEHRDPGYPLLVAARATAPR